MSEFLKFFIEQYKPDLSRMGFDGHPLKASDGLIRESVFGKNGKIIAYKTYYVVNKSEKVLLAEDFGPGHFFELQCFLDKYIATKKLPVVNPRENSTRSSEELNIAMDLLRVPMLDQNDFIERLKMADQLMLLKESATYSFLDGESFDGKISQNIALSGKSMDLDSEFCYYVRYVDGKKYWEIYRTERGSNYTQTIIYNLKNVYEFLLNVNALNAI